MFRGNTDKLERHELRERALGEQLKKALAGLDKRQETAESTVTAAFQTLESRLVALEGVVSAVSKGYTTESAGDYYRGCQGKRELRLISNDWGLTNENGNVNNTEDSPVLFLGHEDIRDAILSLINMFRGNTDKLERHELRERALGEQLKKALAGLDKRQETAESTVTAAFQTLESRLVALEGVVSAKSQESSPDLKPMIEELVRRTESNAVNADSGNSQRIDELNEIPSLRSWMIVFDNVLKFCFIILLYFQLDEQMTLLQGMNTKLNTGITINDLQEMSNNSQTLLQEVKYELLASSDRNILKLDDQMVTIGKQMKQDRDNLVKSITEISERTEELYGDIQRSYDQLLKEVKGKFSQSGGSPHPNCRQRVGHQTQNRIRYPPNPLDEQMALLQGMNTKLNTGITINDLQEMSNNSQTLLQEVKYELLASSDRNILKLDDQMVTIGKQMKQDRDNLVKSITEISERTEELYGDIQRSYDQLLKEVKGLVKVEEVLIQTADNVLDTKRRIEYGTHQILVEVGDLIKTQSKDLNDTVNSRFDIISQTILDNQNGGLTNLSSKIETEISQVWRQIGKFDQDIQLFSTSYGFQRPVNYQILVEVGDLIKTQSKDLNDTVNSRFDIISQTILDNQNGGLTNLSSKIETEISQVWRQIGIMYQTLTSSAQALDRLQQQTEIYVNGSLSTMDNMEGKVGQITGRMGEVDENLNYLLGKLSLVTHEFNQIKSGLGEALDNIRSSFQVVQSKVKQVEELGPAGPNPIPEELDDSVLSKTRYSTS
ncbi:uncharacterized protein LOC113472329 [Diaphorina citri]|uniref:Uncharacterized protein LOC113472329 n=1 Tax=Diaphorina citri TaxID=121845 RepID=A0A3Q0JLU8_DIACI|nr:uncharacterized protein LOC113472329 [Diaphorina citri]